MRPGGRSGKGNRPAATVVRPRPGGGNIPPPAGGRRLSYAKSASNPHAPRDRPVTAADLSPFAEACGLRHPIDLRVVRADGVVLAEGELDIPCALVGRDPVCEVTLTDADVSLRHACVQAVGGRVLVADIGSRTGLSVGGKRTPVAWLTPTDPVVLGQFHLSLRRPLLTRPTIPDASPLAPDPAAVADLPRVGVRFLNGRSANAEWVVNRVVTFVGRAGDCKISLAADDIAPYHCYFVLTPAGLWVVDLLTAVGVCVNGDPVRFHLLLHGDRIHVGRFRLGVQYLDAPAGPAAPPPARPPLSLRRPTPVAVAAAPGPAGVDPVLAPMVAEFAASQERMLDQFRQSMVGVFQLFGEMHRGQVAELQAELTRMAELNVQVQKLQAQAAADPAGPAADALAPLQAERQTLWQRLSGLAKGGMPTTAS